MFNDLLPRLSQGRFHRNTEAELTSGRKTRPIVAPYVYLERVEESDFYKGTFCLKPPVKTPPPVAKKPAINQQQKTTTAPPPAPSNKTTTEAAPGNRNNTLTAPPAYGKETNGNNGKNTGHWEVTCCKNPSRTPGQSTTGRSRLL